MGKIKGKFFLPENYKRKRKQIDGTIEIQDNGLTYLDLSGSLLSGDDPRLFFLERKEKINIWGIAENGSKISLIECNRNHSTVHLGQGGMKLEKYRVEYVLKNDWVENIHTKYFNKLSVNLEGLDQWLNISGGSRKSISSNNNNAEAFSYNYEIPDSIGFKIENGLEGSFYFSYTEKHILFGHHLQQRTCLELSSEKPESLSYFLEKLFHFTRFLNIISDSVLDFEFVIMTSFKNVSIVLNKKTYYEDLNLIFLKENPASLNSKTRHSFLVKYDLIKEKFEEIIKAWFTLKSDPIRRIIDILYECIENKNKTNIHLFLAVSHATEGLYVIINGKRNYFNRMIRLTLEENSKFLFNTNNSKVDIKETAEKIKNLRNALTHIGELENQKINKSEIYFYTKLLKNILSIALLKKIGIAESAISINH